MNFEVLTMRDRDKRNQIFDDLRRLGNPNERQCVKFSDCEEIEPREDGQRQFVSTFSVAYPRH